MDRCTMKKKFYEQMRSKPYKANSFRMSSKKYLKLIDEVKTAKRAAKKENRHYWLLRQYDVITVNSKEKLIVPLVNDKILYYVFIEELFDILYETHVSIGHGGRDKMRTALKHRYKNITAQDIQCFLNLCESCLKKRKCEKKGLKPFVSSIFNSRCQVDLIDFQSRPDGEFKFIMIYQDCLTKFVVLRALKSKKPIEIAEQLLSIFLLFGAPSIIQSNNGIDFVKNIIENLRKMWPELKIVYGEPRQGKLQEIVEPANQSAEHILNMWIQQQPGDSNWSRALSFVQFMKNKAFHPGIKKSPFLAMFGQPAKVGLASSSLSPDIIEGVDSEEDLERVLPKSEIVQDFPRHMKFHEEIKKEKTIREYNKQGFLEDILIVEISENVKMEVDETNERVKSAKCKICGARCSETDLDLCKICLRKNKLEDIKVN